MNDKLPIGTKIKFLKTLTCPACECHPSLLFATKDETGEITGYNDREGYWAKTDSWPNPFGISIKEFIVI